MQSIELMVGTHLLTVFIVFLLLLQGPQEGILLLLMPQLAWRQGKEKRDVEMGLGRGGKGSSEQELKMWKQSLHYYLKNLARKG